VNFDIRRRLNHAAQGQAPVGAFSTTTGSGRAAGYSSISPSSILYRDGEAYTEQQYRSWMQAAGFTGIERGSMPDGTGMFRGRIAG
jgi:hypothetical protein